jgi:hypothetical protein
LAEINQKEEKTMTKTFLKTIGTATLAILALAGFARICISAQDLSSAESKREESSKGLGARALEGSWTAQATVRNCDTGAPIGEVFAKMITFMQGGTLQEDSTGSAPLPRASGHGVWKHLGENDFAYAVQFFRFNTNGTYHSKTVARWQVVMDDSGDSYSATATVQVFLSGGGVINVCTSETATRFE